MNTSENAVVFRGLKFTLSDVENYTNKEYFSQKNLYLFAYNKIIIDRPIKSGNLCIISPNWVIKDVELDLSGDDPKKQYQAHCYG